MDQTHSIVWKLAILCMLPFAAFGQRDRIAKTIDPTDAIVLAGNLPALARPQSDIGLVEPDFRLNRITLVFKPSSEEQANLERLLAGQMDPSSRSYHRWLTPEQFADRFGLSAADVSKVVAWLQSQGFTIEETARARNWIAFSGAASQVRATFATEIHRYRINGELRFANAAEPSLPAALEPVADGLRGLNDFHPRSQVLRKRTAQPAYTVGGGHFLTPDDLATIYDLTPLYNAGFDGLGQTIAVIGQSDVDLTDISAFRSLFGLPATTPLPQLVLIGPDPGTTGDLDEADLDLEMAGAIAREASLLYVYAEDAFTAAQHAIDQDLAPIITFSFGACETQAAASSSLPSYQAMAQQANAEGITWVASSGDSGPAACDPQGESNHPLATNGLAVNIPASIPEVTGVGGTEFNEGGGAYWSISNSSTFASALSYIPEIGWNDSAASGFLAASGGGSSIAFGKPAWQSGLGVPNDGARDVPDVALAASANHDGYLVCTGGSCAGGISSLNTIFGGTSAGAPAFAGMLAVLQQYLLAKSFLSLPGLSNVNASLYRLASNTASVFHDITSGNNIVGCGSGSNDCPVSGVFGFSAGPGYDEVTGLGSVDANNLVTNWSSALCAYSINPTSVIVGGQSGSGAVALTTSSGCPWTTSSNANWLTVTSSNGSGSASINYSVAANHSAASRTGTISIAGQKFIVTQNPLSAPSLSIAKTHSGGFIQGQQGAGYTVTVSNATGAQPTSGTVTVTETAPSGLALVSMAGSGWTCAGVTCARSDALNGGSSYPAIAVTVNVASNAASPQVNAASVSGGGSAPANTTDSTIVSANPPVLGVASAHSGSFNQGQQGAVYIVTVSNAAGAGPTSGTVTVTETVPAGLILASMTGNAWTCAANKCARGDVLNGGGSYGAISVTVNVASNAGSPQVNTVSVSGGGSAAASATDSTIVLGANSPVLSIASTQNGTFKPGQQGASYTVTVSNALGAGPTSGTVIVTETLAPALTLVSMAGAGWSCSGSACTRSDVLSGGNSYPAITVIVNVRPNATSPQVNSVSVSGGGAAPVGDGDPTTISIEPSKAGIFRQGFLWVEDVDGNQQINVPPDRVFAWGGVPGDIPVTGDWNGSGTMKAGVFRPNFNGQWLLDYDGTEQNPRVYYFGGPGDLPVVGDWTGTGTTKIGIFHAGFEWILDTTGNGRMNATNTVFPLGGIAGDLPVVGDWNGSGTSKPGIFRQGYLWILDTNGDYQIDAGDAIFPYGGYPGDVPLVGDWTGTGISQVGILRQGFLWVLDANGDHQIDAGDFIFPFGGYPGDKPVVGKW